MRSQKYLGLQFFVKLIDLKGLLKIKQHHVYYSDHDAIIINVKDPISTDV